LKQIVEGRIIEGRRDDPERYRVHIKEIILRNGRHIFDAVLYKNGDPVPGFMRIEAQNSECEEGIEFIPYSMISSFVIEREEMTKTILKYDLVV